MFRSILKALLVLVGCAVLVTATAMRPDPPRHVRVCDLHLVPVAHAAEAPTELGQAGDFANPEPVTIQGYTGQAMEPFVSRDGKYLFFNNLDAPGVNTNLYWATRIDDTHFAFQGEIRGVNTPALEAVASMDRDGNFYFVSDRSYDDTASTLYRGKFANGEVAGVELVPGVSTLKPGIVNFDAEISADGNTLFYVESQFTFRKQPESASIAIARRKPGGAFRRDPAAATILKTINNDRLNYAPAVSASECELFFTRLDPQGPRIYRAARGDISMPFENPTLVAAITGFAEAPSLSRDEKSLYYHRKEDARFAIYRVTRSDIPH